jgi:predicted unusual protein kinase regulating ubiquinone biosynthesis (AarF/ABC1/UbiB family)
MSETKEMLEATCKGLEDKIGQLNMDLKAKQQELEDANKPVISSKTMDVVNDAINEAIENYNFDNTDQYELDFSLDYDGRVQAETINLTDTYELMEAIVTKVKKQFKIVEELDTTEPDNHKVTHIEKII